MFDVQELIKRIVKYLFEGIVVALVAYTIPKRKLDIEEVMIIALVAAMTFSLLDVFVPAMGATARTGAGFGIGANLVGFPKFAPKIA
jgi:ABC-type Co2+ transport system permease subunit